MPTKECSLCELDVKSRKVLEGLLRLDVGVRDVAEYSEWLAKKAGGTKGITKSAVDRHRNNGHMATDVKELPTGDEESKTLREFVRGMFESYQKANKGKIPSHKEMMDLLLADAKLNDIEARRHQEEELTKLFAGASYRPKEVPVIGNS